MKKQKVLVLVGPSAGGKSFVQQSERLNLTTIKKLTTRKSRGLNDSSIKSPFTIGKNDFFTEDEINSKKVKYFKYKETYAIDTDELQYTSALGLTPTVILTDKQAILDFKKDYDVVTILITPQNSQDLLNYIANDENRAHRLDAVREDIRAYTQDFSDVVDYTVFNDYDYKEGSKKTTYVEDQVEEILKKENLFVDSEKLAQAEILKKTKILPGSKIFVANCYGDNTFKFNIKLPTGEYKALSEYSKLIDLEKRTDLKTAIDEINNCLYGQEQSPKCNPVKITDDIESLKRLTVFSDAALSILYRNDGFRFFYTKPVEIKNKHDIDEYGRYIQIGYRNIGSPTEERTCYKTLDEKSFSSGVSEARENIRQDKTLETMSSFRDIEKTILTVENWSQTKCALSGLPPKGYENKTFEQLVSEQN